MDGALGGDVADLVDLLHGAGEGAHHRGDGDGDGLALLDVVFIGVAEVEGQLQLLVVDQGGHGGVAGDLLVGGEFLHVGELAGEGSPDGEVGGLLRQVLHVLLQGFHLLTGGGHLFLGSLTINGVQGLTGGDHVAGGDKDLLNGAAGGQGDGRRLLGLGVALTGGGAGDGAEVGHSGLHLGIHRVFVGEKAHQEEQTHCRQKHDYTQDDKVFGRAHPALFHGGLGRVLGRGGLRNSNFCHDMILL